MNSSLNMITNVTLDSIDQLTLGNTEYAKLLASTIKDIRSKGIMNLMPEEVREMEHSLASTQINYLIQNDSSMKFYKKIFDNLGVVPGQKVNMHELLPKIAYPVTDLADGKALIARGVTGQEGGRVFQSSGTTDPGKRKLIRYDALTSVFLREMHLLLWEQLSKTTISSRDHILFLAPEQAKLGMPFAAFVADFYASRGAHIHWGMNFIHEAEIQTDPGSGVPYAVLDFKKNIKPDMANIMAYYQALKSSPGGTHVISGLLTAIIEFVKDMAEKTELYPDQVIFGGGLKKRGIPPEIQAQGDEAVQKYLAEIAKQTGATADQLMSLYKSEDPRDKVVLDDILVMYFTKFLKNATGALTWNVFAAADMLPAFFAAAELPEIYGKNYFKIEKNQHKSDLYIVPPGVIVQLIDLQTRKVISPKEVGRPGIIRFWNPYNTGHLQAAVTQDYAAWQSPARQEIVPPYMNGKLLQYYRRTSTGDIGGIC